MKRYLFFFIAVILMAVPAYAAEDPVTRAMKLYEKRHYEEAALLLRTDLPSVEQSRQGAAHLTLGMIYLKIAELHRAFHKESLVVSQDYLKKLSASSGKGRSRFSNLYYGTALIEAGKPAVAVAPLERFIADESLDPMYRAIAKVNLGLSLYLNGDKQRAEGLWSSVDAAVPEVGAELASAYGRAGLKDKNPVALCDQSLAELKKTNKPLSIRMVKNIISVYSKAGLTGKGLEVLHRADTKAYSYRETLGKSKVINFYDNSLLGDIATLTGQASVAHLEKAAAVPEASVKDPAEYYLSLAYSLFGSGERSAKVAASFISTSRMPQQFKDRARVWKAVHDYQSGRQTEAVGVWNGLALKQPQNPDVTAEILFACARTGVECGKVVRRAEADVEAGQGRRFTVLNYAIGGYYLAKNNRAKAISFMEAGRDKSNKNKIEANDPLMLVDLAGLYYRSKKFSEALEIYFEMSKQFPVVRHIQETMQGVYAIEHKSAGDVKIF